MRQGVEGIRRIEIPARRAVRVRGDDGSGFGAGRVCVFLAVLVALILAGAGCAGTDERDIFDNPPVELRIELDKQEYRVGEALICTAIVKNVSGEEVTLPCPDTKGLACHYGPVGTDIRYQRTPVRSRNDESIAMITIAPGEEFLRKFVLLRMTGAEGMFAFHGIYKPAQSVEQIGPTIIAKAVFFAVKQPVLFKRDIKGLLLRKEALRIVEARPGAVKGTASARLFRNEAGFLDWYVEALMRPEGEAKAEPVRRAFLVNPYLGSVRAEITPVADPNKEKSNS